MSCLGWNSRGLGNPQKVQALKKEISSEAPEFVFLCEMVFFCRELEGIFRKLGFECCFGVDCAMSGGGRSGGLGLLWREDFRVSVITSREIILIQM